MLVGYPRGDAPKLCKQYRVLRPERFKKGRRTLDVAEQERDLAGRQSAGLAPLGAQFIPQLGRIECDGHRSPNRVAQRGLVGDGGVMQHGGRGLAVALENRQRLGSIAGRH